MNALIKKTAAPGAAFEKMADPRIRPDELLIKVHRASICGSDLPIFHWNSWAPGRFKTPSTFGHEFCGVVAEIGSGARDFKIGDFVSVESHIFCGVCYQCRNGQRHVCREMKIIGVDGPGGFGEYAAVPARCAWKHLDGALRDLGSLLEPFGNAGYSVLVEPVAAKSVLVMGCGPQGLFSIAVAKASGADRIVAVEGSRYRAELALRMGAAAVVSPGEDPLKAGKVRGGFDVVCEMSGAQAAITSAFKNVRSGGRITAFGIPSKNIEIDWANDLIFKGVRVHGIVGREIFETWHKADRLLRSGAVDLNPVVTHVFPLKDYEAGFAAMTSPDKKCGKVVFVP